MAETQDLVGESLPPAPADQVVQAVNVQVLIQYLRTVVPALLEEQDVLHPSFQDCLSDPAQVEKLRKFISEPQTKAILIQRASVKGEVSCVQSAEPMTHTCFVVTTSRG